MGCKLLSTGKILTVPVEEAPANSVPAAAVIQRVRALFGMNKFAFAIRSVILSGFRNRRWSLAVGRWQNRICERRTTKDEQHLSETTEEHRGAQKLASHQDGGPALANFVSDTLGLGPNIYTPSGARNPRRELRSAFSGTTKSHDWHVQPSCQRPNRVSA